MLQSYQLVILFLSPALIFFSDWCEVIDFYIITVGAGLGGFVACRALSQRNSDPAKASCPWDIVISNMPFSPISVSLL